MHTFADYVVQRVKEGPESMAVIDGVRRMTRSALFDEARVLGSALLERGIRRGAAIAFQLPNWHEACVINLAASLYGFRLVPLLTMYREAELTFILSESGAQAIFLPRDFRGYSYADLFSRVQPAWIPSRHVFIVRGHDERYGSYESLINGQGCLLAPTPAEPDAVKTVLYTSGSTGRAKGVLHSDRTICALITFARDFWSLSPADVALVPSPLGHVGGSMYAFEFPWIIGMSAVLMETWDPDRAIELIDSEKVSFFAGATPFLAGLVKAAESRTSRLTSLRRFICGGASVPPSLIEDAAARLPQCTVSRAYGSTEVPLVAPGIRSRADSAFGATTDGECAAEVQIVDEAGMPVAAGEVGEILARAPRMFLGYLNPRDNEAALTPEGYFRMGDLGRLVAGRFIEITGRKKDIIIRMGENISPLEVENVLLGHGAIKQVSIVGIPDARTGEAAVAFAVLHEGAEFTLADMHDYLSVQGLAKQKFPEHLRIVTALPTNSIGKVLKRELQAMALAQITSTTTTSTSLL